MLSLAPFIAAYHCDLAGGDRTSIAIGAAARRATAALTARAPCVAAGLELIERLPRELGLDIEARVDIGDGQTVARGTQLGHLTGNAAHVLAIERTLLNALQILCGIAAETQRWVKALPPNIVLLDTRKGHPGLRDWERLAVRAGGGSNHRYNLADVIMLKDNHIALMGSVTAAVQAAAAARHPGGRIICEVESPADAKAAIAAGADALLVDNQPPELWPTYYALVPPHIELEFSGGIAFTLLGSIPPPPRKIWISTSHTVMAAPPADIGLDFSGASA